jgi:hypothetical protein
MFTLLLTFFCHGLWLSCQKPQTVVLADGQHLPALDYVFKGDAVQLRDRFGNLLLIHFRYLDYVSTFLPKEPEPLVAPPRVDRRRIPWEHPSLESKTTGFRRIEISDEDLRIYGGKHQPPVSEKVKPERRESASEERRERQ